MTPKDVINLFKRFLIIFLCCIPIPVVLTIVAKLSSIVVIVITVVLVGGIFVLEEYLYNKKIQKRNERRNKQK